MGIDILNGFFCADDLSSRKLYGTTAAAPTIEARKRIQNSIQKLGIITVDYTSLDIYSRLREYGLLFLGSGSNLDGP